MKFFLSKYFVLGFILIAFSCEETLNNEKEDSYTEEVLVLSSIGDFDLLVSEIGDYGSMQSIGVPSKFESFENNFDRFLEDLDAVSDEEFLALIERNNKLFKLVDQNDGTELVPIINDDIAAKIFNKDGLLVIDDIIYKMSELGLESAKVPNSFMTSNDIKSSFSSLEGYQRSNITFDNVAITETPDGGKAMTRVDKCSQSYRSSKKNYRLIGEIFYNNVGFLFSNVGSRTKHQRKRLGIWFNSSTTWVSLVVSGEVWQELGDDVVYIPANYSGTKNNDGKIEKVFEFCVNVSCTFGVSYMDNTHKTKGVNGTTYTCGTNF